MEFGDIDNLVDGWVVGFFFIFMVKDVVFFLFLLLIVSLNWYLVLGLRRFIGNVKRINELFLGLNDVVGL